MLTLTTNEKETIAKMQELLDMPGEKAKELLESNQYPIDSEVESITLEFEKYIVELRVCSGDMISPAFWGEGFLCDINGEEISYLDIDSFEEFSLFDEKDKEIEFLLVEDGYEIKK